METEEAAHKIHMEELAHEQLLTVAQQIEQTRQRMESRGARQQAAAPARAPAASAPA